MVTEKPKLLLGKVMHERLLPKHHRFTYDVRYLDFNIQDISDTLPLYLPVNKKGMLSFYTEDHGFRDSSRLEDFAHHVLKQHNMPMPYSIRLVSIPRTFNYVFNPVSFWLCYDHHQELTSVIAEVNNTFGQTHTYLCRKPDHSPITAQDWLTAEKCFHVSPFFDREGFYHFNFDVNASRLSIHIHYHDQNHQVLLKTSLSGQFYTLSPTIFRRAFWIKPFNSLKVIFMIHIEAIRLWYKRAGIRKLPPQKPKRISVTHETRTKISR